MRSRRIFAYAAIYILWGGSFLAIRELVTVAPPFFTAGFRFFWAGVILAIYSLIAGAPVPAVGEWRSSALIGLIMFTGTYGCLFWAEQHVASGYAAITAATVPVWVFIAEWLWLGTQKITAKTTAGIVLGLSGVGLLVLPRGETQSSNSSVAAILLVIGPICWALGTAMSKRFPLPHSKSMSAGLQMAWGGAFLFVVSGAAGEFGKLPHVFSHLNWRLVAGMTYLIILASIVAFTAYVWLISHEPPTRVASYAYVNPLVAVLAGTFLANEKLSPLQLAGAALVMAGVFFTLTGKTGTVPVEAKREPVSASGT